MRFVDELKTVKDGKCPTNNKVHDMAFKVSALVRRIHPERSTGQHPSGLDDLGRAPEIRNS